MPNIETADLKQFAVLWVANLDSPFDEFGNAKVVTPVQTKVRWESTKGESSKRKATAYVNREIPTGSTLWLGKLANLPVLPEKPKDLMEVVGYNEIPDTGGKAIRRWVDLVLLGTQLPQPV